MASSEAVTPAPVIVVGIDGSTASREAQRWASRLAWLRSDEILVVHALGRLTPVESDTAPGDLAAVEKAEIERIGGEIERIVAEEWCGTLRSEGRTFRIVVREGHPVDVLAEVARAEAAELVVVGSHGIGAARARAFGSTSLHLLQVSPGPVLVVPDPELVGTSGHRRRGLHRILLAVDGTGPADRAVALTAELAAEVGARVTMVHAVEEVPVFPLGPATEVSSEDEDEAPARDQARLAPLREQLCDQGVHVDLRVDRGLASELVPATAELIDADLVVLGSTSASSAPDPLAGSVSRRIVARLRRPALVVPEVVTAGPPPAGRGQPARG